MPSPLRIAHLTPAYFSPDSVLGGGERYVYYLAQSLRQVGNFQQCIFTTGPDGKLLEHDGITVRVLRNESPRPGAMDAYCGELWQQLRGYNIVHLHQSLTLFGTYATVVARSLGIPIIGTDLGGGENELMLEKRGLELLDGVISISHYAHSLIAHFFSGPHEILVGPVDTDRFAPSAVESRDRRTVLCVSRIMPHKGLDRVVTALPDGLRLVIVGSIYHTPYYQLLRRLGEGKDIEFIHDADDSALLHQYRTARIFIQASTARDVYGNTVAKPELMGLTTLEAMACSLPVVVSDVGSLPELVPDQRFGRVFSGTGDLSAILNEVAIGKWPSPNAGALARAHVQRMHGMNVVGGRLAKFYQSVLSRRRRSGAYPVSYESLPACGARRL